MSTFEVSVTPTRIKQMRKLDEIREPTDVFMGPFTAKATVNLVDIPVGKIARRFLTIHNKFEDEVKILVTKAPKTELCISMEWTSNVIPANSTITLELVWNPAKVGIFKDCVQITDSRGNKKDIYLTMKSIELKKAGGKKAWAPPVLAKRLKASPQRQPIIKKQVIQQSILKSSGNNNNNGNNTNRSRPLGESNLNGSHIFKKDGMNFSNLDNLFVVSNTDKENASPVTPKNTNGLFKPEKFTPKTETIPKESSCLDYLASLPTPKQEFRSERKRPGTPERVRFQIPEQSYKFETSHAVNASDMSVMAQMPTPNAIYGTNKTYATDATPLRANATFDPHVVSTLTKKMLSNGEGDATGKELFFDALDEMSFATPKPIGSMERLSSETYIKTGVLERLSSETYVKCLASPMSIHEEEYATNFVVMDKTRIVTPPPPLSIIAEELEGDCTTNQTQNIQSKTFNMPNHVEKTPPNNHEAHKKAVENIVMTPLSRAKLISQSNRELNKDDLDFINLKANQGSMPNLFDERTNEQLRNIENNRYFFQNKNPQAPMEHELKINESITSTTSNLDTMFRESEIRAQSSQFNLHEIGKSTENIPMFNKTVTKHTAVALSCYDIPSSQSRDSLNSTGSSTASNYKTMNKGHKPYVSTSSPQLNRGISSTMTISPPKQKYGSSSIARSNDGFVVPNMTNRAKTWGAKQPKKINMYKYPMKLTLQPSQKQKEEERVILYNPDLHISAYINPDPFAATTTVDPFLASTMYLDERSTDKHEQKFKKWLNALVTIPADLDSIKTKIDMAKLFNEVQNKKQVVPDTKEKVVSKYYKTRLDYLRVIAIQLYQGREISEVLTKLMPQIEKSAIVIRADKDLHLQIGLQQQVLDLLFSFNTLWLRLGLEVVFGEIIPMSSNRDVHTLARFIIDRMFKDQYLEKKYTKVQLLSNTYKEQVKKHTLKKFFCLLMFLDEAKNKKIIKQNPCLFTKTSPYKETREVLLRFSSMLLSSMGDITKYLKRFGYVLTHKQTYLDEFDYAFTNLAVDLRDGIRLTKIMEIITLREDLSPQLRVPAVSRLQKIHNVDVALKALATAEYEIKGDITAKDIADGHREKTLSILWQIIHKFRAPKFNAAAKTIQHWWRNSWLRIAIARRIAEKKQKRMENAAFTIQRHFRGWNVRKWFVPYRKKVNEASIIIQRNVRRLIAMKKYKIMKMHHSQEYCATKIQSYFKMQKIRREFLIKRSATVVLQRYVRSYLDMKKQRQSYLLMKSSAILIQQRFRAHKLMIETRNHYLYQRSLIIKVQQKYRSLILMREQRKNYLSLKNAAITIQNQYRATQVMKITRTSYLELKSATILIQRRFRANLLMVQERYNFLHKRCACITIQHHFRAYLAMKQERTNYILIQMATYSIQQRYRALMAMRRERKQYLMVKNATSVIQKRWRATLKMRETQNMYLLQKSAAMVIQSHFRAFIKGRQQRKIYLETRTAAIFVQRQFRANMLMRREVQNYKKIRQSCIIIQKYYRGYKLTQEYCQKYQKLQSSALVLQRKWRATVEMRKLRVEFLSLQFHTTLMQQRFRGLLQMRRERHKYLQLKSAAVTIQRQYRAQIAMRIARQRYLKLKSAVIIIQRRYKAKKLMVNEKQNFVQLKTAAICLQNQFRAVIAMKRERKSYLELKSATQVIQARFRAQICMRRERVNYLKLKCATIVIQQRFKATLMMRQERHRFVLKRLACVKIQQYFLAQKLMIVTRKNYLYQKSVTIKIQQRYRALLQMRRERQEFVALKSAVITVQKRFRAQIAMKQEMDSYLQLKSAAIVIQRRFRAQQLMKKVRAQYLHKRSLIIKVQQKYRGLILMRKQREKFLEMKIAAIIIQNQFRAVRAMKEAQKSFVSLKSATIIIQRRFRAQMLMKRTRNEYLKKRALIIKVQQKFRANKAAVVQREYYLNLKEFTIRFQARIRGYLDRQSYNKRLTPEVLEARRRNKAAKKIQAVWRGFNCRKKLQTKQMKKISIKINASKKTMHKNNSVKKQITLDIGVLKGTYRVYEAISILKRLERLSRIIPQVLIPHSGFIATFCYGLMAQTIRSEPDKQVIELCACIILNLSRYPPTKEVAFSEYGLMTIAQMLLRWCDKECGIFISLCTLVWIFGHDPVMNEKIRKFLVTPDAIFMLRETKKLTLRKEKMRQTVNKQFGSYLNDGINSNTKNLLPNLEPDYGLIKGKPYVFMSPVFALDTLLNKFNVHV